MNRIFKLVWNRRSQNWIAVSELAGSQGKCSAVVIYGALLTSLTVSGGAQSSVNELPDTNTEFATAGHHALSESPHLVTVQRQIDDGITRIDKATVAVRANKFAKWRTSLRPNPPPTTGFAPSGLVGAISTYGLAVMPELTNDGGANEPFAIDRTVVIVNERTAGYISDRSRFSGVWVERADESDLTFNLSNSHIQVDAGPYARRIAGLVLGYGDERHSYTVALDNVTVRVDGHPEAGEGMVAGITHASGNDLQLSNTSFHISGQGNVRGYDYQQPYRQSDWTSKCRERCASRKTLVVGKTTMTVENRSPGDMVGDATGWSAGRRIDEGHRAFLKWTSLDTLIPGRHEIPPTTVEFHGESITNLKGAAPGIQLWSYRGDDAGTFRFKGTKLSGTLNGENGIRIRGGGQVHFEGDVTTTSPIHLVTHRGEVFFNQLSTDSFTLAGLRSERDDNSDAASKIHLGDKTLIIDDQATAPYPANRYRGEFTGSEQSRLIKRGHTTWTMLANHPNWKGDVLVDQGALQIDNDGAEQSQGARQITVKSGAMLAGRGYTPRFWDRPAVSEPTGHVTIERGGSFMIGRYEERPERVARTYTLRGNLVNDGEVHVSRFGGVPGNTLNVLGDYHGGEGSIINMAASISRSRITSLLFDIFDDGYDIVHDELVIHGDSSGQSGVRVFNFGGTGAQIDHGSGLVKLITVMGKSDAEFKLIGRATAGAYDYYLVRGDAKYPDRNADKNWYLVSDVPPTPVQPTGPLAYSTGNGTNKSNDTEPMVMRPEQPNATLPVTFPTPNDSIPMLRTDVSQGNSTTIGESSAEQENNAWTNLDQTIEMPMVSDLCIPMVVADDGLSRTGTSLAGESSLAGETEIPDSLRGNTQNNQGGDTQNADTVPNSPEDDKLSDESIGSEESVPSAQSLANATPLTNDKIDSHNELELLPDPPPTPPSSMEAVQSAPLPSPDTKVFRPEAAAYASNAQAANSMFELSLSNRLGSYHRDADGSKGRAWIRYSGSRSHLRDASGQLRTRGDKNTVLMGADLLTQSNSRDENLTVGLMGGYGHYHGNSQSSLSGYSSVGKVDGHSVGIYGTYQQNAYTQMGLYVDGWALWNRFDNKVNGDDLPAERYNAKGLTASVEVGYNAHLSESNNVRYVLQPHAQVIHQNVRSDSFRETYGTHIDFTNHARTKTVLGLRASAHIPTGLNSLITPHVEANWLHTGREYGVNMNEERADMHSGRNIGQLKLGLDGDVDQRLSINVALFHNQGNAGYRETGGNLAITVRY